MLKLQLGQISSQKGAYQVFLDRDHKYVFTRKKSAEDFLIKVSSFLTRSLEILNKQYLEAYQIYRRIYFTVDKPFVRLSVNRYCNSIEEQFEWIFNRGSIGEGQYYIMPKINLIYSDIYSMLSALKTIASQRNETISEHEIDNLLLIINMYYEQIEEFRLELRNPKLCKIVELENISSEISMQA